MKPLLLISMSLAMISGSAFLARENTAALTRKGQKAFEKGEHAAALKSFDEVLRLRDSPLARFNAGTASIAAGEGPRGIEHLKRAAETATIAADALYNEGNALLGKDVEGAIRAYKESLRREPSHASAKRNLEIAMRRREQQKREGRGKGNNDGEQQGGGREQQPEAKPDEKQQGNEQPRGETDGEQLLRAVEQQEREELSRMRKARARERAVGW